MNKQLIRSLIVFIVINYSFPIPILNSSINITLEDHYAIRNVDTNKQIVVKNDYYEDDKTKREIECLSKNIYFESALESTAGKLAVALVTRNRVKNEKWPSTYCSVIHQARRYKNGKVIPHRCQFSWYCDGKPDIPYDGKIWKETQTLAKWFYLNDSNIIDITDGATHYHADYIRKPKWAKIYKKTVKIDTHIFYVNEKM